MQTKFKLSQKVWTIFYLTDKLDLPFRWEVYGPSIIEGVTLRKYVVPECNMKNESKKLCYLYGDFQGWDFEEEIFKTKN